MAKCYVNVDREVDIDVHSYFNSMTEQEKYNMKKLLHREGETRLSYMESEWMKIVDKLRDIQYQISNEDENIIHTILNKY